MWSNCEVTVSTKYITWNLCLQAMSTSEKAPELDPESSYGALIHFKHYIWKGIAYWKWRSYVWCSFSSEKKKLAIKWYSFKLRNGAMMHQEGPGWNPRWSILSKGYYSAVEKKEVDLYILTWQDL